MAPDRQRNALQVIYSFFLGLMITAFIGVGVYTAYPSPDQVNQEQLQELYRQQEDVTGFKGEVGLTSAEKAKLTALREEIRTLEDEQQAYREKWTQNTSIILIVFATIVMAISLIRAEQLRILSNGLLLGGLFTMVYGVGWIIAGGSSWARFGVMTFALVATVGLGYARFVTLRAEEEAPAGAMAGGVDASSLEARVTALERRAAAAAAALAPEDER